MRSFPGNRTRTFDILQSGNRDYRLTNDGKANRSAGSRWESIGGSPHWAGAARVGLLVFGSLVSWGLFLLAIQATCAVF